MIHKYKDFRIAFGSVLILSITVVIFLNAGCKKTQSAEPTPMAELTYNDTIHTLYKEITSDTILKNLSNSGVDYRIANFITISNGATLTIEAGVTLQVVQNGGFNVTDGGALKINGTSSLPVTVTGQVKSKGFWRGIFFTNTANPNNQLTHAVIEYAGAELYNSYKKAAINVYNSTVAFDNCTIRNNKVFGLYFDSTSVATMHNCTITANDSFPVMMLHNNCDLLTNDNSFTGNANDKIFIRGVVGVNSSHDLNIKKLSVPYFINGRCLFAHSLTIEAGTRFKMQHLSTFYFDNDVAGAAKIIALGAVNDSIIMESYFPDSAGYWQGITLHGGCIGQFSYCRISDSGVATDFGFTGGGGAIFASGGSSGQLDVKHCLFRRSTNNGIVINIPDITYNLDIETLNSFVMYGDTTVFYY